MLFFRMVKHVPNAKDLPTNCNYYFFKNDIKPAWEDEANKRGGKLVCLISQKESLRADILWLDSVKGSHYFMDTLHFIIFVF